MKKKIIALLPMKGHSERVKNKNLRSFNEKPLCSYVIAALDVSTEISEICVDTDSERIAECVSGLSDKISIINRPEELRGDMVSMNRIIEYDISVTDGTYYLQTHATNPLLTSQTINKACQLFMESDSDSLFSVTRLQTRLYDKDGRAINHDPERLIRTQDLDPVYEENSNIYIFTKDSFAKTGRRIGKNPLLFEMDYMEAMDIDTETDFLLAEYIYRQQRGIKL